MNKEFYTGNDAPVSLSITRLASGYAVTICLGATSITTPSTESTEEETSYSYHKIEGMTDDVSLNAIIRIIEEQGYLSYIDSNFIDALTATYPYFSRSHFITAIVRSRYTADDVEAILLNRGDNIEKHEAEYAELQEWRALAKSVAKSVFAE